MGFRFRKSVKIAPGVKLNFGKKSVGVSVGNKYGGVSVNSSTGARARVSVPGTGISYSEKISPSKLKETQTPPIKSDVLDGSPKCIKSEGSGIQGHAPQQDAPSKAENATSPHHGGTPWKRGISIILVIAAIVVVILIGISAIRANAIQKFQDKIRMAVDSIGLTEESGLDYVLTNFINDAYHVTVSLQAPIDRDSFPTYVADISEAINPLFADEKHELDNITFYLNNSSEITYSTDLSTSSHITMQYSEVLGNKLSDFGWLIYDALNNYNDLFQVYPEQKVSVHYGGDLLFNTGLGKIGSIVDTRSGESKMTTYNSWDDLAQDFPALRLHLSE